MNKCTWEVEKELSSVKRQRLKTVHTCIVNYKEKGRKHYNRRRREGMSGQSKKCGCRATKAVGVRALGRYN